MFEITTKCEACCHQATKTCFYLGGTHLKRQQERERKSRIVTWVKMRKALKKYLPYHYRQDAFLKFHNFRQNDLSVEEYIAEFDHSMMRCDIVEPEEQMVARYLGGLHLEINNIVQLHPTGLTMMFSSKLSRWRNN